MNKPHVTLDNTIHIILYMGTDKKYTLFQCVYNWHTNLSSYILSLIYMHTHYGVIKQDVCTYTCTCLPGSAHGYHHTFDEHTCMTF